MYILHRNYTAPTGDGFLVDLEDIDGGPSVNEILERDLDPAKHNGKQYSGYADSAFGIKPWLQKAFQGAAANVLNAKDFNKEMNSARETVEWGFGKNEGLWPCIDFEKQWKMQRQAVGKEFEVYMFWTNCHSCAYGSETASYFSCQAPELDEYLQMRVV